MFFGGIIVVLLIMVWISNLKLQLTYDRNIVRQITKKECMINKEILTGEFNQKSFACPKCKKGTVILEQDKSAVLMEHNYGEIEDVLANNGLATSYLKTIAETYKCTEDNCDARIILVREEAGSLNKQNGPVWIFEYDPNIVKNQIKYVDPPINIFEIPENTPQNIKKVIISSFSLLWIDLDSCANKLRITIELLLTNLNIKKERHKKNKKTGITEAMPIPLSIRIQDLQKGENEFSKFADQLFAIKWIGNLGSHEPSNIDRNRIIEAYEIIEHLLNEIFDNRDKYIQSKTKEIIENKGRR